jgi:hypothetical protein
MLAAIAVFLVVLSGCGAGEGTGAGDAPDVRTAFEAAADRVAAAWRTAPLSSAWRSGYVPLRSATVVRHDPGFDDDTKQAFLAGWYRATTALPGTRPANGVIRFPDGSLTVPLISAREAYGQLDQGDPPACPDRTTDPGSATTGPGAGATGPDAPTSTTLDSCTSLTVTAAELGTVTVRTSRGDAHVPAWLFTVAELSAGPVARVAVADSAVGPVPTVGIPEATGVPPEFVTAQDLVEVDGARLTYRLGVGACDTKITPLVQEYPDLVVVAGHVVRTTGVCTEQLLLAPVAVTLGAPLGARPVLSIAGPAPLLLTDS